MTDKQIIIDGVDVSGCCQYMPRYMEDYDIDTLDYCGYYFKPCKDVGKCCYYKQLKRKEQECEKFKQALQEIEKLAIQGNIYCIDYNVDDCEKCIKQNDCKTTLFKQILQKCEVIDE